MRRSKDFIEIGASLVLKTRQLFNFFANTILLLLRPALALKLEHRKEEASYTEKRRDNRRPPVPLTEDIYFKG